MEEISKKVYERNEEIHGEVVENETSYKVEAEVGRLYFATHSIDSEGAVVYDTSRHFFEPLCSKEAFRSVCYNELLLAFVCDESYRKTEMKINRIRWQEEDGAQSRTIANVVEREGVNIQQTIDDKVGRILVENGFDKDGRPLKSEYGVKVLPESDSIPEEVIRQAVLEYNEGKDKELQIEVSELHDTKGALVFFIDGARDLHSGIKEMFGWVPFKIILDWHHLEEKCKMQLSLGLKGRDIRNTVLSKVTAYLWVGKVDKAVEVLRQIDEQSIKSKDAIEGLIGYFDRNWSYIPCYALRKKLGLCNSSNRGEKANDLIVAERQKHNGMSWSKIGSSSLASVITLHQNGEQMNWLLKREIEFRLVNKKGLAQVL